MILRLRAAGIEVAVDGADVRLSGPAESLAAIDAADREMLMTCSASLAALLAGEPAKGGRDDAEGMSDTAVALARHLLPFWEKVARGERDATFTNLTHRVVHCREPLDTGALARAAEWVVRRHPVVGASLNRSEGRIWVRTAAGGRPNLVIQSVPADASSADVMSCAHALVWEPMSRQPTFHRIFALTVPGDGFILGFVLNHLIADRLSVGIFFRDLWAAYAAFTCGETLPPAPQEFHYLTVLGDDRDPVSDDHFAMHRAYWRQETSALTNLPLARAQAQHLNRFEEISFRLDPEMVARLREFASSGRCSLLSVLLASHATAQAFALGCRPTSVMLVDSLRRAGFQNTIGKFDSVKPLNIGLRDDLAASARLINAKRLAGMRFAALPYEVFGTLFFRETGPFLPFINFIDNGQSAPAAAGNGSIRPFYVGHPPNVFPGRPDFEGYYLHIQINPAGLVGTLRYCPLELDSLSAETLVAKLVEAITLG